MTTSGFHQRLLRLLEEWCRQQDDVNNYVVLCDTDEFGAEMPPTIERYRPDLIWVNADGKYRFIGEAKTTYDIRSQRSLRQIEAYLEHLKAQGEGEFILAVPWGHEATARSMLSQLDRKLGVHQRRWTVISNAPKAREASDG